MTALDTRPQPPGVAEARERAAEEAGAPPQRWKWTGDDLIRMGETGLLPPEGKFELLDGEIYQLMPPKPLHASIVDWIGELLETVARTRGAHVREEKPIRLSAEFQPEPDLALVRGRPRDYRDRFPGPEDVLLVVEVADTSLQHDRERKVPVYAEAGIPECWIVNLQEQQVEVYREPAGAEYQQAQIYRSGQAVEPLALPETSIAVADLLGETEASESTGASPEE